MTKIVLFAMEKTDYVSLVLIVTLVFMKDTIGVYRKGYLFTECTQDLHKPKQNIPSSTPIQK